MSEAERTTTSRRTFLAATIAAAAGGVVATIPAVASAEPDPIFAVIERHRAIYEARGALLEAGCTDEEADDACDLDFEAWADVLDATPTTVAGAAALAAYAAQHVERLADCDSAGVALQALADGLGRFATAA